mmetsp:Transcript_1829/g.5106  ORF Transcript_1829/g.5106 Transcript_1829/m.5106 type:complete len:106 (-) Transcript_1829:270-587(-)
MFATLPLQSCLYSARSNDTRVPSLRTCSRPLEMFDASMLWQSRRAIHQGAHRQNFHKTSSTANDASSISANLLNLETHKFYGRVENRFGRVDSEGTFLPYWATRW